MYALTV